MLSKTIPSPKVHPCFFCRLYTISKKLLWKTQPRFCKEKHSMRLTQYDSLFFSDFGFFTKTEAPTSSVLEKEATALYRTWNSTRCKWEKHQRLIFKIQKLLPLSLLQKNHTPQSFLQHLLSGTLPVSLPLSLLLLLMPSFSLFNIYTAPSRGTPHCSEA